MAPDWLVVLSWCGLGMGFVSAAWIVVDVFVRRYRQLMPIMEAVWPITGLYFGPVAVWGYRRFGRPMTRRWQTDHDRREAPDKPHWAAVAVGVSHCGAGCTLGDIIAEFVIFAIGATIAGRALFAMFVGDYLAAVALGIVFQYFAIAPMRGLGLGKGLREAAKADVLSLTAFEVGLFGWMALMYYVFFPDPHLEPSSPVFWFLMQIGMVIGFFTAWPANVWLIRSGIKDAM
ncbi:DUF4396 domain-containing protein [Microlunatus elymi]|uniref:DUF4396 domain-containing protein n=1 Tax=Microlunatus elymi TaxID=2596828 RepID=A0A516PW45_9ACTN|nr:DUF4396 domain-containing protein [Microlunatus elymi]QDP95408.1 DUF4396 domain-containing protein [Microlunatus elymi]